MMRRRTVTFGQALLVPALATIGLALLVYGRKLALEEMSFAAPSSGNPLFDDFDFTAISTAGALDSWSSDGGST
ncbi:MAG: hypothetical protein HY692_09450, partial [Cyanobacteria bacterium NC_groundwater_1444_Ag_S-0.65um_54_12]|nr:hypothetical protein [Cyanobacteria bacterium NC_groundwater_1444_Ag_S-0.65um_54_12]